MVNDTVVAAIDRERLSDALTALHRSGYGANARVMDAVRGDLAGQLSRAGIEPSLAHDVTSEATVLLAVFAPGRVAPVIDAIQRAGARAIHVFARGLPLASATPSAIVSRHRGPSRAGRRSQHRRAYPNPAPSPAPAASPND